MKRERLVMDSIMRFSESKRLFNDRVTMMRNAGWTLVPESLSVKPEGPITSISIELIYRDIRKPTEGENDFTE